jgi:hypothetical protein
MRPFGGTYAPLLRFPLGPPGVALYPLANAACSLAGYRLPRPVLRIHLP